jgi:hypothetical protein
MTKSEAGDWVRELSKGTDWSLCGVSEHGRLVAIRERGMTAAKAAEDGDGWVVVVGVVGGFSYVFRDSDTLELYT